MKRSLPDDSDDQTQNTKHYRIYPPPPPITQPDVLIVQEDGELDEEEEKLCNPPSKSDHTNFLHDIESEFNEDEKLGGKLKDNLAKNVNGRFKAKLGNEMKAKRFDAHKRPENRPELVVRSVNKEIWRQLPPAARKLDLKLAQIQ